MAEKSLEERVQRLEDIHEIQNLMSRYEYWHTAGLDATETAKRYAEKTPGVSVEVANWGVFEGTESIKRFYRVGQGDAPEARVGGMFMHTLTTPVIEVAGDGKTAKGVWISPGHESHPVEGGKPQALWAWCKYGVDFVKEDGEWKYWHVHVYPIFMTPYERSWVEAPPSTSLPRTVPDDRKPDRPTTYLWEYSPDRKAENVPAPPEPYETWDGKSVA